MPEDKNRNGKRKKRPPEKPAPEPPQPALELPLPETWPPTEAPVAPEKEDGGTVIEIKLL